MGGVYKHLKLILFALTLLSGAACAFILLPVLGQTDPLSASSRVLIPFVPFLIFAATLYYVSNRRDLAPDFLRHLSAMCFERDGLCFLVRAEAEGKLCRLAIYHQNRQIKPCHGFIILQHREGIFPGPEPDVLRVPFFSASGAYGKVSVPWRIPVELQGAKITLNVYAQVHRQQGFGRTLRFRDGTSVNSEPQRQVVAKVAVSLLGGHPANILHYIPAQTTVQLPAGVLAPGDPGSTGEIRHETFWTFGDPVGKARISVERL